MRKILIVLLVALFLTPAFAYALNEGSAIHVKEGSGATQADALRVYQMVRYPENNADDITLTTGQVVVWDTFSDDGVTIGLLANTGSIDSVAGVVVGDILTADTTGDAEASTGRRNWGYIQTYGFNEDANVQSTLAVGQSICVSDQVTSGYAGPCPALNAGRHGGYATMGFAYDAVATKASTDTEVFIRLR